MSSDETQLFLDLVCAQIRRRSCRAAVRAELGAHIEDHAAALAETRGFSPEQAEKEAVRCMGDPVLLGRQLQYAYSRWHPYMPDLMASLLFIAALAAALVIFHAIYRIL